MKFPNEVDEEDWGEEDIEDEGERKTFRDRSEVSEVALSSCECEWEFVSALESPRKPSKARYEGPMQIFSVAG